MITLPHDSLIAVPPEVAVCPICGAKLSVQLDEWVQADDGSWMAGETPPTSCETEPDFDDPDYDDWLDGHYSMPYVDWLPVELKIGRWLRRAYRFDMEAHVTY